MRLASDERVTRKSPAFQVVTLGMVTAMAALCAVVPVALAAEATPPVPGDRVHFPPVGPRPAGVPEDSKPPFSSSVRVGDTLYISGVMDIDPATGKPGTTRAEQARLVLDALSRSLKAAGLSMDDLVWVQVFATDLGAFDEFGSVYSSYFQGPLPARSFVGVAGLMGGAHFELNGIAVRRKAAAAASE